MESTVIVWPCAINIIHNNRCTWQLHNALVPMLSSSCGSIMCCPFTAFVYCSCNRGVTWSDGDALLTARIPKYLVCVFCSLNTWIKTPNKVTFRCLLLFHRAWCGVIFFWLQHDTSASLQISWGVLQVVYSLWYFDRGSIGCFEFITGASRILILFLNFAAIAKIRSRMSLPYGGWERPTPTQHGMNTSAEIDNKMTNQIKPNTTISLLRHSITPAMNNALHIPGSSEVHVDVSGQKAPAKDFCFRHHRAGFENNARTP